MFIVLATTLPWQAAACSAPACNTFREVYNNGENLCNKVWGDYYKYETDEANAFTMSWDDGLSNPNTETVDSLSTLAHISDDKKATCHLENNFGNPHDTPQPQELSLCSAYNDNACCPESAVASVETMKESLAEYFLKWDSCGPLSAQCEQYFISEVCFYDCEPAVGHYRRFPATEGSTAVDEHTRFDFDPECDSYSDVYNALKNCTGSSMNGHNGFEIYKMPIKASYCDAWYEACADDFACASGGGDLNVCALEFADCDGEGVGAEIGSHSHTAEIHPYEWAGSYKLPAGSHTWTLSMLKGKSSYPDASMRVFITALDYGHGHDHELEDHAHTDSENAAALTAAEKKATAMFGSTTATAKENGDVIRPAAVMQRIDFDNDNTATTLTIRVEEDGYYGIFTEHMPWEFDARVHLNNVNGKAVAPSAVHDFSSEHNGHTHTNKAEAPGASSGASVGVFAAGIVAAGAGVVAASFF